MKIKRGGFTLIELLVVISIISLLSSIVYSSLNTARESGRDAVRKSDIRNIQTALFSYQAIYGSLPGTTTYGETDSGNWDYSTFDANSDGNKFLDFLVDSGFYSEVPVDPINNITYKYRYFCYDTNPDRLVFQADNLEAESGSFGINETGTVECSYSSTLPHNQ